MRGSAARNRIGRLPARARQSEAERMSASAMTLMALGLRGLATARGESHLSSRSRQMFIVAIVREGQYTGHRRQKTGDLPRLLCSERAGRKQEEISGKGELTGTP